MLSTFYHCKKTRLPLIEEASHIHLVVAIIRKSQSK